MKKISIFFALGFLLWSVLWAFEAGAITRDEIIQNAEKFVQVQWTCTQANVNHPYTAGGCQRCDFYPGEVVRGEAYSFGGTDSVERFLQRLAAGDGAGSHLCHYNHYGTVPPWATGIDCSAFVSQCWEISRQVTWTLPNYSVEIPRSQLKRGDILNKPHSHVRLFDRRAADGRPIVYEASGSATKVVHRVVSWGTYTPRRFNELLVQAPPFLVRSLGPQMAEIVWLRLPQLAQVKVYQSTDGKSFSFIQDATDTSIHISNLVQGQTTYFRLAGVDSSGSAGDPGEVLAVTPSETRPTILVVNGYDRKKKTNTLNFVVPHAKAIGANGYGIESCSNELVAQGIAHITEYGFVDWILGEESSETRTFDPLEQQKIEEYLTAGGGLFVSGSEIAYDLEYKNHGVDFLHRYLKVKFVKDNARVFQVNGAPQGRFSAFSKIPFGNGANGVYLVSSADCLEPVDGGQADLLYVRGGYTAGVEYTGTFDDGTRVGHVMVWGFPFETVARDSFRTKFMGKILGFMGYTVTSVPLAEKKNTFPAYFQLSQGYPNPVTQSFLTSAGISFRLKGLPQKPVQVTIFNLLGQKVFHILLYPTQQALFSWRGVDLYGRPVPTGTYFLRASDGHRIVTRAFSVLQ